ncbi:hypothetical protein [Desulfurella sp.]|uniref:hypothetical protein n=1 Tax=Desulfurella sp. TaxID=1962857 RepID=UPI0025B83FB2|nr:hypothetical protein [Desulfurella sp.]
MNQDELKKEISENKFRNLYIFNSDDYFLKQTYIERLSKITGLSVQKHTYETFKEFLEDIPRLCYYDLFYNKVIKHIRLNFELEQIIDIKHTENILILDPIKCSSKIKSDSIVNFRPLSEKEIKAYLKNKLKYIDTHLLEKISSSPFYSNATALNLLVGKLSLSKNYDEIDFLEKESSSFEAIDAIVNNDFDTFCSFIDRYDDYPLVLISMLSTIFFNAFLALHDVEESKKNYYKNIVQRLGIEKLESLITILYDLDKLYKSANIRNLLPLKLKIFNWMVQK